VNRVIRGERETTERDPVSEYEENQGRFSICDMVGAVPGAAFDLVHRI
jgi:hypothetical protein